MNEQIYKLNGSIQHYAWGGYDFIPDLLGIENFDHDTYAELWLGAHPKAPSLAHLNGEPVALSKLIDADPEKMLGPKIAEQFGGHLPFLFKVLDARDMLSIQVHPSKSQAENRFEREEASGIPLDSASRNYKDKNHKPEVHVALTDFWMLHGFRPEEEIADTLHLIPEFVPLLSTLESEGLAGLYAEIMRAPQTRIDDLLKPLLNRLSTKDIDDKDNPDFWAKRAAETFPLPDGHIDRGILSIYLLNLLHLKPGESTFQAAGVPHAYLFGTTMELMANSDNVLRGGLTSKHIDVDELLNTVEFRGSKPEIIQGKQINQAEKLFPAPAPDFQLSEIRLSKNQSYEQNSGHGPDILMVLQGQLDVKSEESISSFSRGDAFFVPDALPYGLEATQPSMLFRASVP